MMRFLVIAGLLGVAAGVGWLAHSWSANTPTTLAGTIRTCRVVCGRLEQNVKARGIVRPAPNALVRVGFPFPKDLARRISRLPVVEGDRVETGALVAQLDDADNQATLNQLEADLQVFQRRLQALKALEPVDVHLAEAFLAERKAQMEHTRRLYDRQAMLTTKSAASAEQYEIAANDLAVAQARFEQAEVSLQQTRVKYRTDIATLEAQIKQARAAIETIQVQIRWSTLRSPFAVPAQVFVVHQRQGELTSGQPTVPVLTLLDPNQLQVHLFVDEVDFGRIKLAQPVTLRAESYPDEIIKGRIIRVLPQPMLQENVVYYLAIVEVEAKQRPFLRAEMTALGHVQVGVKESVLWLPLAAVRSRPDGWYVLRSDAAGRTVEVPVQVGWKGHGRWEILGGLAEGDEVFLEP
jgi:HlyD family secretion protein/macrolide-specific efflux system membrane fusion protein